MCRASERIRYSAFGVSECWTPADVNLSGVVDAADADAFAAAFAAEDTRADLNYDGEFDSIDEELFSKEYDQAVGFAGAGELSVSWIGAGEGGIDNRIGYAGYVWDPHLRLWLARHRWLDPVAGRWLSEDPIGTAGGWNLYQYCGGDAIGCVDPLGLDPLDDINNYLDRRERRLGDRAYSGVGPSTDAGRRLTQQALGFGEGYLGAIESTVGLPAAAARLLVHPERWWDTLVDGAAGPMTLVMAWDELSERQQAGVWGGAYASSWMAMSSGVVGQSRAFLRLGSSEWALGEGAGLARGLYGAGFGRTVVEAANTDPVRLARLRSHIKGDLGEARASATLARAGYTQLPSKLPSNQGLDGVFVKFGIDGTVLDIIVVESKYRSNGKYSLRLTEHGRELSTEWLIWQLDRTERAEFAVRLTLDFLWEHIDIVRRKINILNEDGTNRWNRCIVPP